MTCCSWTRSPVTGGRSSASSARTITRLRCSSRNESAITSRAASFRSTGSIVASFLLNSARNRDDHIRRSVAVADRAPRRLARAVDVGRIGRQHPQTGAGVGDMPDSGWLTSCAIDAVRAPRLVTRATCASSVRSACQAPPPKGAARSRPGSRRCIPGRRSDSASHGRRCERASPPRQASADGIRNRNHTPSAASAITCVHQLECPRG